MCSIRTSHRYAMLVTWAMASACASPHPPPSTPPVNAHSPVVRVPENCEQNLSGPYVHSTQPEFEYLATDDGVTLQLSLLPPPAKDQPAPTRGSDAGTSGEVQVVLVRSPDGFIGETRAFAYSARGTRCPVRFETFVEACTEDGLTLRTVPAVSVDDACNRVDEPQAREPLVTQQLKRLPAATAPGPSPAPAPVRP